MADSAGGEGELRDIVRVTVDVPGSFKSDT